MKYMTIAASAALLALVASADSAQELAVRTGVVAALQVVQDKTSAVSNSSNRQLGGMLGRAICDNTGYSYETTSADGHLGADVASSDISMPAPPAAC